MKLHHAIVLSLGLLVQTTFAAEETKEAEAAKTAEAVETLPKPSNQVDTLSYSFGQTMSNSLKSLDTTLNVDYVVQGMRDGMGNKPSLLTQKEMTDAIMGFKKERIAKEESKQKAVADSNFQKGEDFLAENAKKEGVVVLPSGLQYKILKAGTGNSPTEKDRVTTHYEGTLINGTVFDSSYKRNQPATFPVSGVIRGWTEALQLMKEGAKWELYIPSKLAYGGRGAPPNIGPNETLVFQVELISVQSAQ